MIIVFFRAKMSAKKVILVTGGTGMVGSGIRYISETEEKRPDEQWIFVCQEDADLRLVWVTGYWRDWYGW